MKRRTNYQRSESPAPPPEPAARPLPEAEGFEQLAARMERAAEQVQTTLQARAIQPVVERMERMARTPASSPPPMAEAAGERTTEADQGTTRVAGAPEEARIAVLRDMRDVRYGQLPKAFGRDWRNPAVDRMLADFIVACGIRRPDLATHARNEVEDYFRLPSDSRADALEREDRERFPGQARALQDTTAATSLIPVPLANAISLLVNDLAKVRTFATRFESVSNNLRVPTESARGTAKMVAEGATSSDDEPTYSEIALLEKKMQSQMRATEEALRGITPFSLVNLFTNSAGRSMATLEDVEFCTSTGAPPSVSGSFLSRGGFFNSHTLATLNTLGYADMVAMFFGLQQGWRDVGSGVWFGDSGIMQIISTILDGNGRPIFVPANANANVVTDTPSTAMGTIFGKPVLELPTAAENLYFGDMRQYAWLDGGAIRVQSSEHVGWSTDTIAWKFTRFLDGDVWQQAPAPDSPFIFATGIQQAENAP